MDFLEGRDNTAEKILEEKMTAAAEAEDFERAIKYRGLIAGIRSMRERTLADLDVEDSDYFAYVTDGIRSAVSVMPVRGNKLLPAGSFPSADAGEDGDALASFIMQYYETNPVPLCVYVNLPVAAEALEKCLGDRRGGPVHVRMPKRGMRLDLVRTAEENARECMEKAADLLKLSALSVAEVGRSVGYPNQLHFSRAFKSVHGVSPRAWRREHAGSVAEGAEITPVSSR